jgi:hypothetical protein
LQLIHCATKGKKSTNETTMHMLLISHKTEKKLQCKLRTYDRTFAKLSMYCKAKHLSIVHRSGNKREEKCSYNVM